MTIRIEAGSIWWGPNSHFPAVRRKKNVFLYWYHNWRYQHFFREGIVFHYETFFDVPYVSDAVFSMGQCVMNFIVSNTFFFHVAQNIKAQCQFNATAVAWNWRFVLLDGPFLWKVMEFWRCSNDSCCIFWVVIQPFDFRLETKTF